MAGPFAHEVAPNTLFEMPRATESQSNLHPCNAATASTPPVKTKKPTSKAVHHVIGSQQTDCDGQGTSYAEEADDMYARVFWETST